ncbi:MAG: molybdopterin oxidoreductase family protein [Ktedonobacteraceae bacterium]
MTSIPVKPLQVVRGACSHDCPDTCAWQVTVEDGVAIKLAGDPAHPFTRGGLCAKVNHYLDRVYSPERILFPLRRSGPKGSGQFERVTWEDALADIAARFQQICALDGPTAILPYSYLGTQGIVQNRGLDRRFFARLGATRLDRTICGRTASAGISTTQGTALGILPEDIVSSRVIILWGTNPVVTNLHLWPFIRQAKSNGARIILIDPIKTRTAADVDWHVRPLPGTDVALALGMMQVIVAEKLYDVEYVAHYTLGFEQLCERLQDYPPERVAALTGLAAAEIVELARAYAMTRPSVIKLLIGMEHHNQGAMIYRTIACLPALVGAWRERGGGLMRATSPLFEEALNLSAIEMPELVDHATRVINMVQLGQALTDPDLAPPIRALVVYNSNPATTTPNQNLILQGLRRDDLLTVVHEQFLTDTASYADYVLPATTQVEHLDLVTAWGHTYLALNQPALAPRGEAVPNTEFFRRLARHMGFDEPYLYASDEELIRTALASSHPFLKGITFERLVNEGWAPLALPHDWRPFAEGGFPTPSGKCEFFAASLATKGIDPLPAYIPARELVIDSANQPRYPLTLLTVKSSLHFLNSGYANLPRHLRAEREPLLDMHPYDAEARGIVEHDRVRVCNERGVIQLRARISDRVRAGVVALPSGWWASLSPNASSANAVTDDGLSDWGGGGNFHDTFVEVTRAAEEV